MEIGDWITLGVAAIFAYYIPTGTLRSFYGGCLMVVIVSALIGIFLLLLL